MKKWILGVVVLTSLSFSLSAQQHKTFRQLSTVERAQKMIERITEKLKLSKEQEKQIGQLVLENATRQEELLKTRKAAFEAQRVYRKEQEQKIASMLSEEQKQIWEQQKEMLKQGESRRQEGNNERRRRSGSRRWR